MMGIKIPRASISVGIFDDPEFIELIQTPEGQRAFALFVCLIAAAKVQKNSGEFKFGLNIVEKLIKWNSSCFQEALDVLLKMRGRWVYLDDQQHIVIRGFMKWNGAHGGPRDGAGRPHKKNQDSIKRNQVDFKTICAVPVPVPVPSSASAEVNTSSPPQASADHTQPNPKKLSDRDKAIEVYNAYPRHVGREEAIKAILSAAVRLKASGNHDPWNHLLVAARAFAASPAGRLAKPDYRPHPSTWFNQGRFDDDRKEWEKPNGNELSGSNRQGRIEAPAGKYDDLSNRSNVIRLEPPGTLARPSEAMEAHGSNPPFTGGNGSKALELSDADIPF